MTESAGNNRQPRNTTTALVTGGTEGIGYHTARGLAARGAAVVITGRNPQRGSDAVASIVAAAGHDRVSFVRTDHSIVEANRDLGPAVTDQLARWGLPERLDLLVNNVGGIWADRTLTPDGYEATLALNFLAPYVVTGTVLPLLEASPAARCINVISSVGWLIRQVHGDLLDDLDSSRGYVGIQAHAKAKLLNLAWTLKLSRDVAGSVTVAAVNPGMAWTTMTQALTPKVVPAWRYFYPMVRFFQKRSDAAKAARICVQLATEANAADIHGHYLTEHGKPGKIPAQLLDQTFQERVVSKAQEMVRRAPTASI